MATKKYLDLSGLTQYDTKIKSVIPSKTSDLTNDSGFITDSKVVVIDYGSNIKYSTIYNYINNGYAVFCRQTGTNYDLEVGKTLYFPATSKEGMAKGDGIVIFEGYTGNGLNYRAIELSENNTGTEDYGYWSYNDIGFQEKLVSGTNIKTINNTSLLGSGNISISGGSATDVQINGTSIVSNDVANIITESAYNSSTNKIATMSDVPLKTIMQAVKTSDTTSYSTSYNYFSPLNGDGTASTDIEIGSGLTFGKKSVTYGDRTNNSVYGFTIGAGISVIKVCFSVRYLNNHTSQLALSSTVYRDRNGTSDIVYGISDSATASSRLSQTGEAYISVQQGDFIYLGGYRGVKNSDVDVISTNNATNMSVEVIQ